MLASDIAKKIKTREQSAEETVRAALNLAHNDNLNALLLVRDEALTDAKNIDAKIARGEDAGPLAGVPVVIKDNMCMTGTRTTAGSKILENFVAPYTATAVQRLQAAGAVIIGKSNLDEFAMGSSGENSAYGPTLNPHDTSRVPGGSSSGSAAVVAANMVSVSLGSDTGGSIRLPASFCGVLGLKPTYGRVSRYGLVAFASSLDQIGAFTRSSLDLALTLDAICGHDAMDSTSLTAGSNFVAALDDGVSGLRVGLVTEALGAGNNASVLGAIEAARKTLSDLGATVKEVSLPSLASGLAAYYLICCPEASSNLARFDGMVYSHRAVAQNAEAMNLENTMMRSRGEAFGPEVRRRILMGTYALSKGYYDAYYSKALTVRALIAQDFARVFENVDVLMLPTAPTPAFQLGEKTNDPMGMYLSDIDTVTVNLAGLPGLSLPFGFDDAGQYSQSRGLPVGVQFVAPAMQDERLLTVARALEQASDASFFKAAQSSRETQS